MAQTVRCARLFVRHARASVACVAGLTVALIALLSGCKPAVSGQNVMPDDPNMSPGQKRQAMIQWHQQHDKPAPGNAAPQSGQ